MYVAYRLEHKSSLTHAAKLNKVSRDSAQQQQQPPILEEEGSSRGEATRLLNSFFFNSISNNLGKRFYYRESSAFAHNGGTFEMDDELDDLEDNYNNFDESFNDFGDRSHTNSPNNILRKYVKSEFSNRGMPGGDDVDEEKFLEDLEEQQLQSR